MPDSVILLVAVLFMAGVLLAIANDDGTKW